MVLVYRGVLCPDLILNEISLEHSVKTIGPFKGL